MFALDMTHDSKLKWVMWESYRMEESVWKEDGDTKNQDNYPQQNHAQNSVALGPENEEDNR